MHSGADYSCWCGMSTYDHYDYKRDLKCKHCGQVLRKAKPGYNRTLKDVIALMKKVKDKVNKRALEIDD